MKRELLAVLTLSACAATPDAARAPTQKSLFIGKVESAKMLGTMDEFRSDEEVWLAEVYELKLKVLDVLAGAAPGKTVEVKVTAHARRFEGATIVVMIDPELKMLVPGQSWWTSIRSLVCLPAEMLKDASWEKFVDDSFAWDRERCVNY